MICPIRIYQSKNLMSKKEGHGKLIWGLIDSSAIYISSTKMVVCIND